MNKFRRKAKRSLLGALSLLSAFSSVSPMSSAMNRGGSIVVEDEDDDLSGYDTEAEEEDVPELKKPGLSTAAKVGIGVGVGGVAALGIGLLASHFSSSDGEIGKKITIKDIDLENKYHNGKIDGFNVGEKAGYDFMKRDFPNSGIKDGFCYEYLGGKEFKIVDVYLNEEDSFEYLGADIKNSPTLKNMNESNGDAIDKKTRYRVTKNANGYRIVKLTSQTTNQLQNPVQNQLQNPVQNQLQNPVQNQLQNQYLPQQPAVHQRRLFTAQDILAMTTRTPDHGLDLSSVPFENLSGQQRMPMRWYLYKIDGNKVSIACIDFNTLRSLQANVLFTPDVGWMGSAILDSEGFVLPENDSLKILPDLKYYGTFTYSKQVDKYIANLKLMPGQLLTAEQAVDVGLVAGDSDAKFYSVDNDGNLLANYDVYAGSDEAVPSLVNGHKKNAGLIYFYNEGVWQVRDVNEDYVKNHSTSITLGEATLCTSLMDCELPSSNLKVRDFVAGSVAGIVPTVDGVNLWGARFSVTFDGEKYHIEWADASLPGSLFFIEPLAVVDGNFDWLDKFRIYRSGDYENPIPGSDKRNALINRRVKYDKVMKKLVVVSANVALSGMELERRMEVQEAPYSVRDGRRLLLNAFNANSEANPNHRIRFLFNNFIPRPLWNSMLDANKDNQVGKVVSGVNSQVAPTLAQNLVYNSGNFGRLGSIANVLKSSLFYVRKYCFFETINNNNPGLDRRYIRYELIARRGDNIVVTQFDFPAGTRLLQIPVGVSECGFGPSPENMPENCWIRLNLQVQP